MDEPATRMRNARAMVVILHSFIIVLGNNITDGFPKLAADASCDHAGAKSGRFGSVRRSHATVATNPTRSWPPVAIRPEEHNRPQQAPRVKWSCSVGIDGTDDASQSTRARHNPANVMATLLKFRSRPIDIRA
ncbi:hypothetical protein N7510_002813 [Penicillium lagena]|uniref:uncharacterized protein n=1 Tax=Penicillium lagena TaxID=94218 RepID=UPI0025410EB8|nr:uncharacterized protein N7510_002813 [Penicillium lagena]KAJ5618829.1 hypothetical protein N7510_002813 [Penicillium lagena]